MKLQIINPIEYRDWDSLLIRSNDHSFFHSTAWARVLKESYRYKPIYFVLFEKDQLTLLMPFMEVNSLLTGKRGVSLPFTDQCKAYDPEKRLLPEAAHVAIDYAMKARWQYLEWRDSEYFPKEVSPSEIYYAHDLDLVKTEQELLSSLRDSNRRNIKKAIREGVVTKISQSLDSVRSFYRLNCLTRKRHGLPPQPFAFFKNIFDYIISQDFGIVVSALHSGEVIAASVFFHFGTSAIYKYGASDITRQNLRPNNLVMWEAIKWYRNKGFKMMSLGRTDPEDQGLLQYKRMWGATESPVNYYRYNLDKKAFVKKRTGSDSFYTRLFSRTPNIILRLLGRLLYRHMG